MDKSKKINVDDPILINLEVGTDEIQTFADSNFGKELSEIELNRIKKNWWNCDKAMDEKCDFISVLIEDSLDNKNGRWNEIDNEFLKGDKE